MNNIVLTHAANMQRTFGGRGDWANLGVAGLLLLGVISLAAAAYHFRKASPRGNLYVRAGRRE